MSKRNVNAIVLNQDNRLALPLIYPYAIREWLTRMLFLSGNLDSLTSGSFPVIQSGNKSHTYIYMIT